MKKITLAVALFTFGLQAQNFPSPYCDIDDTGTTVEEITTVNFAGNTIINSNSSSILIDKTAVVANIIPSETYTLMVEGNTVGDFENDIVAFIDWNQNAILDDAGEIYEVGTIINSNGSDGISVGLDITIPSDALTGTTRIRITKTYKDDDSVAEIDPCAIAFNPFGQGVFPGFGQGLDFALNVGTLAVQAFDPEILSIYPIPTKDILNINYKSELNAIKVYNLLGQEIISRNFTGSNLQLDISTLPAGTYVLRILTKEGSYTKKIVKQ